MKDVPSPFSTAELVDDKTDVFLYADRCTFGDIEIGFHVEEVFVLFQGNCRIDNNKDVLESWGLSDNAAELIPADLWHDDIRAENIRDKGVQRDHCLQTIFDKTDVTTFGLKEMGEEFSDGWIVFCDQNLMHEVTGAAFPEKPLPK